MSFEENVHDSTIKRQIFIERFKSGTVRRITEVLNETEDDLITRIGLLDESFTRRRLERVLNEIRAINERAFRELLKRVGEDLEAFSVTEQDFVTRQLNKALPGEIGTAIQFIAPADVLLFVAAENPQANKLIQGRTLAEWLGDLERSDMARLEQAIRTGFVQGESSSSIARRVRGRAALRFNDGIRSVTRRQLDALVRTSIQAASTAARETVYTANETLISKIRYVATLDGRTTPICRALDQTEHPVDDGPRPPLHFRCRSTTIPVTKSWKELGLDRDEPPRSMRPFIRDKRKLSQIPLDERDQLVGRVSGDLSYNDWLKRQPFEFQDDVLGPSRGKLFRDGGLSMDKFVDSSGREYTLNELRQREADAFGKAGL